MVEGKPVTEIEGAPADSATDHSVSVNGQTIAYQAVAGTITVGGTDQYDAMLGWMGSCCRTPG